MITTQNYFEKIKGIEPEKLSAELKKDYDFVYQITDKHKTWDYYKSDEDIKSVVDGYFASLSEFLHAQKDNYPTESEAREAAKKAIWSKVQQGLTIAQIKNTFASWSDDKTKGALRGNTMYLEKVNGVRTNYSFTLHSIYNEIVEQAGQNEPIRRSVHAAQPKSPAKQPTNKKEPKPVERVDEEIKFIKRYALMQGKDKTDVQLLSFISALQKAMLEKRIRKISPYANEINYIQTNLIKLHNRLQQIKDPKKRYATIEINKPVYEKFSAIGNSEKTRLSVNYLKRYIGIQGKNITKEKAERLLNLMDKAITSQKITKSDPYTKKLLDTRNSLLSFSKVAKKGETLKVHEAVLNGINQALEGCSCDVKGLEGISEAKIIALPDRPQNTVMSSVDFSKLKFDSLGFTGKWKDLIGDPAEGFSAMVFGKPKMGKSYLCMDWAGYLARNHGNTLYVAREEKLDATLQKKLNDKNVKHACLFVSDHLPEDLTPYKFIFLDSVNKLDLEPEALDVLKLQNPGKSFIGVHQTTKEGNFRGSNEYQHDVDVVIEVPERGKAVQFGRFNQGGEINIFEDQPPMDLAA